MKVNYFPGMFSSEYEIDFVGAEKDSYGIWIMREKLTPVKKNIGLAEVLVASRREKDSSILVKGASENSDIFFSVPNEILFSNKESGTKDVLKSD